MAVAQGTCPSCGAPIEFGVGSSIAKVCEFCRATVVRSDRGLQNLGKVAEIANTPSLIAVGDSGSLAGRPFEVLGRVQLDHGLGPWDEYYVSFDHGQAWGWLAYAQGHWYVTSAVPGLAIPPYGALRPEMDIPLGQYGYFRVAEVRSGSIRSAEGELPGAFPPGFTRYYADCYGQNNGFATLDYGDGSGAYSVFIGYVFGEPQLQVTQLGQRSVQKVKAAQIKCPQCGGEIPKLSGDRAERVGCPYCGAVSDIALQQVVAQQEAMLKTPMIPIGSRGTIEGVEYICIAVVKRSSDFDGERFGWEEFLLWSQGVGYRWLVKDESSWMWVVPVNLAELDLTSMPAQVTWGGRTFTSRNSNEARVDYVLGEVYWKCQVGEEVEIQDFVHGSDVLSREGVDGEVNWSYSSPIPWPMLAQAFGLPVDGPGAQFSPSAGSATPSSGGGATVLLLVIVVIVLLVCMLGACGACLGDGSSGSSSGGSGTTTGGGYYRSGSGSYGGGK
ncbi:MAG: DUF4178 domain-containing protein [Polyangiaceae bacterium]|nr:DUF4178 domain-containing protein [Polyangiaceae bacterium]